MKRLTTVFAFLAVFAGVALAARDDDFDFAQKLVERKYYDLAKEQFQKIISDAGSTEQKANGELGLALLLKAQAGDIQADSRREPKEILGVFSAAEDRFDQFLKTYPNHPKRTEAQFEVGNLLRMKGTYLARLVEKLPDQADEYRKAADDAFSQAMDLFNQVVSNFKVRIAAVKNEGKDPDPDLEFTYQKARYFYDVTHYDKGILYPEKSSERRGLLDKACTLLDNFIWDNETNLLGGYAYLYYGLAKSKIGETADALTYLKTAASTYGVPNPKEDPTGYTQWTELYLQAYYQLGLYCNTLKKQDDHDYREDAIAQFEQMLKRVPDVYDRKMGHFALLEYAKSLADIDQFTKAIEIVSRVSKRGEELSGTTDWGAATAYLANKVLNDIIAMMKVKGFEVHLPPKDLMRAAMGKKTARQWEQAIRVFQSVIQSTMGTKDEQEFAPEAWMDIGASYYLENKFLEAMYAYDHVEKTWPQLRKVAGDAAYYRYRSANALYAATKDPRDQEMAKELRRQFATNYKDHPRSIDLQYYEGADLITDADAKRLDGDMKAAAPLYQQALEQLAGVKPSSILYAKAMARMGEIEFQLGKYKDALAQFDKVQKYIDDKTHVTTDEEQQNNRQQALALGAYYGARCYAKLDRYQDVLATLKGYEEKFSDENVKNFHAAVKFERFRAYLQTDQLADAEKQALNLRDEFADSQYTPVTFNILAIAFQKAAQTAKDAKDTDTWRKDLTKAAEYFAYYLGRKPDASWDEWQTIGYWYRDLGDYQKAEDNLVKSLELVAAAEDKATDPPEKQKLSAALENLQLVLSDVFVKLGHWNKARELYLELVIPDESARPRVFALLEQLTSSDKGLTEDSLNELMSKIRPFPNLMEGLARAWMEGGGSPEAYIRAISLLKILDLAGRGNEKTAQYSPTWWRWKLLLCQAYYKYGVTYKDKAALDNVVRLVDGWITVNVLKNSPYYQDLNTLRTQADVERRKLG